MHFLLFDHIENACNSLKGNKGRTALTILGVAIGIASVAAIISISDGASTIIKRQIQSLNNNLVIVKPDNSITASNLINLNQGFINNTLTKNDVESIKKNKTVKAAAPIMLVKGTITAGSSHLKTDIIGSTSDVAKTDNLSLSDGNFIDDNNQDDNFAVIGQKASLSLFGASNSIGQTFVVNGRTFIVNGILKSINRPINYDSVDYDNTVIISLSNCQSINNGLLQIQQINIKATDPSQISSLRNSVKTSLLNNHFGENNFTILSGNEIAQPSQNLFSFITKVASAIALISLIVGGIGIMNIMLVTVAERTREVGIRKAVGARNIDIIWQFIIESAIISLAGGIIGLILGYLVSITIGNNIGFTPLLTAEDIGLILLISFTVGIVFGIYPALKAAHKKPVEALRQFN